jgi:hypothetical protein
MKQCIILDFERSKTQAFPSLVVNSNDTWIWCVSHSKKCSRFITNWHVFGVQSQLFISLGYQIKSMAIKHTKMKVIGRTLGSNKPSHKFILNCLKLHLHVSFDFNQAPHLRLLFRGEIATPNHYCPPGGRTRG